MRPTQRRASVVPIRWDVPKSEPSQCSETRRSTDRHGRCHGTVLPLADLSSFVACRRPWMRVLQVPYWHGRRGCDCTILVTGGAFEPQTRSAGRRLEFESTWGMARGFLALPQYAPGPGRGMAN